MLVALRVVNFELDQAVLTTLDYRYIRPGRCHVLVESQDDMRSSGIYFFVYGNVYGVRRASTACIFDAFEMEGGGWDWVADSLCTGDAEHGQSECHADHRCQ